MPGDGLIVRNNYDCFPAVMKFVKQFHYFCRSFGIKVSRRLVGKDDIRIVYQGAGDGDTLGLSARKLGRIVRQPVGDQKHFRDLSDFFVIRLFPAQKRGNDYIFTCGKPAEKIEVLENKSYLFPPYLCKLIIAHF